MLCDLHTHSTFSDGTLTPYELATLAKERGIGALALTDHNTVSGLDDFHSACKGVGIESVGGVEFSTEYNSIELHIVALFVDKKHYEDVERYIIPMTESKKESNEILVTRLEEAGYHISYEEFEKKNVNNNFNRANIAQMLVDAGDLTSVAEGFKTVLSKKHGFYIPPKRLSSLDTIAFIKSIGAVAVFAHPFLNMSLEQLEEFIPLAKDMGLDAMETYYSKYDEETRELAHNLAKKHGLYESGGSDFHGANKPNITLGTLPLPYSCYEKLKSIS